MTTFCDVAIVGSGPAGCCAAHACAAAGLQTLIIERADHPRDKVCGEACTPRAVRGLVHRGLLRGLLPSGKIVRNVHLHSPGGIELRTALPPSIHGGEAFVIRRHLLDEHLLRWAQGAGAELRTHTLVTGVRLTQDKAVLETRSGDIVARAVIGCDGYHSMVRRSLGAPDRGITHTAFAIRGIMEGGAAVGHDALTFVWDRDLLPAYGWVFPLPGGRVNIGIGLRTDHLRASATGLRRLYERFLESARVAQLIEGARPVEPARGHPLPFTHAWGPAVFERVLLAGDAAGLVNPLTGEGIEYAMESGELAGDAIVRAIGEGRSMDASSLDSYRRVCEARFGAILRLNRLLTYAFSVPWTLDRLFRAAGRNDAIRDDIARIALGGEGARLTGALISAALTG